MTADPTYDSLTDIIARKIGRAVFRFRRLSTAGKAGVVLVLLLAVILLVRGCNAVIGPSGDSGLSFRAGRPDGWQIGLVYHTLSGEPPTEADIRAACSREASIRATDGYSWVEGGVSYDIKAADVDEAAYTDGCVDGFKSALRGEPAP